MSEVVLGLGVSHTPQMSMPSELWPSYASNDAKNPNLVYRRRKWDYDELVAARADEHLERHVNEASFRSMHDRAQAAVGALAGTLAAAEADVLVVVGDDHHEMFSEESMPTWAIYWGESIESIPPSSYYFPEVASAAWALYGERRETYPCDAELGARLISSLNAGGFDIAQLRRPPPDTSVGHPFTLVRNRLMDRSHEPLPIVPVILNTYFPPNRPSPPRCYELGRAIAAAVAEAPGDLRVAVVASGGLSHFVVDEELDRRLLLAMAERDSDAIGRLELEDFVSGTSESLCWLVAGGACSHLEMEVVDYIPAFRTPAGTGCGMAMARWR